MHAYVYVAYWLRVENFLSFWETLRHGFNIKIDVNIFMNKSWPLNELTTLNEEIIRAEVPNTKCSTNERW